MFVGHFAASFIAKSIKKDVPLWIYFLAAQAVDFIWAALMVFGVEKGKLVAGLRGFDGLELSEIRYSHSLFTGFVWAWLVLVVVESVRRLHVVKAGIALGVVLLSHWALDFPVHHRDLPIYGDRLTGLNLWHLQPFLALLLELVLLAVAIGFYWYPDRKQLGSKPWIMFGGLAILQVVTSQASFLDTMNAIAPVSPEAGAIVLSVLAAASYLLFTLWARKIDPTTLPQPEPGEQLPGRRQDVDPANRHPFLYRTGVGVIFLGLALLALGVWYVIDPDGLDRIQEYWPFREGLVKWIVRSPGVLLSFMFLITGGITAIGFAEALTEKTIRRNRFWWLGCESLANGIRVVFLIPISLACWMGIVAAFHVVWKYAPSQQLEGVEGREIPVRRFPAGTVTTGDSLVPAMADSTVAYVQPGIPDSATSIVIWVVDVKGRHRRIEADKGYLNVSVSTGRNDMPRTPVDITDKLVFRRADGTFVATYTPRVTAVDTIRITINDSPIGASAEPFPSVVRVPTAMPLTQAENLWFLPIGLIMAWMLLWPSEPEDKTKNEPLNGRTAGSDMLDKFFNEIVRAVQEHGEQHAKALLRADVPAADVAQLTADFKMEQLQQSTFTTDMSKRVIEGMVSEAVDVPAVSSDIQDATEARYGPWIARKRLGNDPPGPQPQAAPVQAQSRPQPASQAVPPKAQSGNERKGKTKSGKQ